MRLAWPVWRRRLARLCMWLAVSAIVAAAARPSLAVESTGREGILELVIDVSGSTAADDIAPTRLGAIEAAILPLLDRIPPRVRVGLVTFADTATSRVRPTTNRDAVRHQIITLTSVGGSAIGDALRHALNDIGSSRSPAHVLLISDGDDTGAGKPVEVARIAAERGVPVSTIALGTPHGTVTVIDGNGTPQRVRLPPDPVGLDRIATASGGRAAVARSARELEAAVRALLSPAVLGPDQRDMTAPFVAAAFALLAIGRARAAPKRARAGGAERPARATVWRWALPVTLLIVAATATAAWARWLPVSQSPAGGAATVARLAARPLPVAPPSRGASALVPAFVEISATPADRTLLRQAVTLLRAHGALASQRTAEIGRQHLRPIAELEVSACDVCRTDALTSPGSVRSTVGGGLRVCEVTLNTPFAREQARRADVPVRMLVAMALLHEQELCLHSRVPYATEQRLAAKLHNPLLLDLLYAQVEAPKADSRLVEQAVAILRDHDELAFQRHDEIRRRHLNQIGPLSINACRGCLRKQELLGHASTGSEDGGITGCDVVLDLTELERDARDWGLPVAQVTASTLVHEQEHCIRDPDDRETPAIDEERRLALKVGGARLLEYAVASYRDLDASGHWKS